MRKFIQKISHPLLKKVSNFYFSKPRKYSYQNISVTVHPEVFPPHLTISTKVLLNYINGLDLINKTLLELGCGSGIISLFAVSKGAKVVASDINPHALEYLGESAKNNDLELKVIHSDLFSNISEDSFDYIIINPPYYPRTPNNVKEQAWFCGENFEYFKELFHQLEQRKNDQHVLMILSEDCQIEKIKRIAQNHHFNFQCILEKKVVQEKNYIFKILPKESTL